MAGSRVLPAAFYERDPEVVACGLLGKTLVRLLSGERLGGIIVETEAYHGEDDPSSRAYHGRKPHNINMWEKPGHLFVYNVHKYWMLNVVAHELGDVGGVLFRAIEPTMGVDAMLRRRPVKDLRELTSGPGKLTVALGVTRKLNGERVTDALAPVYILDAPPVASCTTSHRIGVTKDLPEELRFFLPGNRFVSR